MFENDVRTVLITRYILYSKESFFLQELISDRQAISTEYLPIKFNNKLLVEKSLQATANYKSLLAQNNKIEYTICLVVICDVAGFLRIERSW